MAHFIDRHVGPSERDIAYMLQSIGVSSLDELIEECVPQNTNCNFSEFATSIT